METKPKTFQELDDAGLIEAFSQYEKSNMSVAEFYEYYGIDDAIFNRWQKRLHKLKNPKGIFYRPEPAAVVPSIATEAVYGELSLPGGITLKFTSPIDPLFIKALI